MAISTISVSSTDTVNTVTVTDSSNIEVVTVGEQGLAGPSTVLGASVADVTAGASDDNSLLIYDHGNTRWSTTDRVTDAINVGGVTVDTGGVTTTPTLRVATIQYSDGDAAMSISDGGGVNIPALTVTTLSTAGKVTLDNNEIEGGNFDINGGDIASATTINKSPVITLAGDLSGAATLTNLGNATLTATITADATALGTDTTGAYVETISAGEGIDVSGSGSETATVTISAEDASDSNKGIASFSATDFSVSSGAVTLQAERIQDLVGAMVSSNTETGITVAYQDGDGTLDFSIADASDSVKGIATFDATDFSVSSGDVTINAERISDIVGAMVTSNTESGIAVTYQDGDNTIDFDVGDFDIALTGDVTGSGTVTNLGNVSISTTVAANSVALGTDTTGNYVATITGGTGIDSDAATTGEGTTHTLSLDLNELATETTIADADFIAMVDATDDGSGKITFENLEDAIFSSVSGDVAIAEDGTATIQANSVALGTDTTGNYLLEIAVGEGLDVSHTQSEGSTATLSAELATETNAGVATFDGTDFTVSSGDVTLNAERVQDIVGAMVGSNTESGIAVTYEDGDGTLDFNVNDPTITIDGDVDGSATMTNLGNTTITATLDTVNSNVGSFGSATAIPALTVNAKGLVTAVSTNSIATSFTLSADSGSNDTFNTGETLTFSGTTNEIETAVSNNAITIGLPDNVTIGGNLTVTGNYTVNGTTTTVNTATLDVEDPLIKLAKANNSSDSVDIGIYGLYDTSGSQDLYAGLFRDASDSGKWKLFKSLQPEPTTTVNTSGTGYAVDTLVANLEGDVTGDVTGALTGNASTATALATARTIGGTSFDGTANIAVALSATATALANARTIHGVSFDGTANIDLTEVVQDTVGAMFSSNTETGITVTYEDGDGTIDLVVGTLNQDTTGNAATATALETGRTIALSGDVAASGVSFDGTGNITLSTTIQANSVALGTDTTGNYVATVADAGNSHITVANSGAESAAVTLNITDNAVGLAQMAGLARGKIIYGDSSGNPAALAVGSNGQVLKSDGTDIAWGSDSGLSTEEVQDIVGAMFSSNTETGIAVTYEDGDGTIDLVVATLNQDTTGNAATATALETGRTIGMTGDVVWTSASFDGSGNVTGSATIQANSVALGTDTTGNYVDNVTGGTGVSVSGSAGEGWEPAISIGQAVGTSDSVTFGSLTVDNFTLNGTELDLSSGDFLLDVAGDITLDADGGDIVLQDGGTQFGKISKATNNITQLNTTDAFIVPLGTTGQRPTGTAGMFRYNSTDGKFEGYTTGWGEIGGGGSGLFSTNKFSPNGSTTAFTLSTAPADEDRVMAFIDGVYQNKDSYTLSQETITFDTAPENGKTLIVHVVGSTVSGANANLDTFTGDGSTTAFTLNLDPVTENNTQVYIDGVYQNKSGYSVSGTTLTFSAAPANTAAIEVATFTQNTLNAPADSSVTSAKLSGALVTPSSLDINGNELILDADADTSITADTDDRIDIKVAGTDQIRIQDGSITPVTSDDIDLGSSSKQFKDAFIHGTLEADAITVDGTALNEYIADTVGAMVGSNTETGIAVTYEDSDNTLDFVLAAAQSTITSVGTLTSLNVGTVTSTGNLSMATDDATIYIGADLDLRVTHSGTSGTITNNTGDLLLDVAGDIELNADGGDINFKDGSDFIGKFKNSSNNFVVKSVYQDADLLIQGNDGGSDVTALTLDMSDAGSATFNSKLTAGSIITAGTASSAGIGVALADANVSELGRGYISLGRDDTADAAQVSFSKNGVLHTSLITTNNEFIIRGAVSNQDIKFEGNDGGSAITALTLDMSDSGKATFNNAITAGSTITGNSADAIRLGSYGALGQTGSGQMTILGHNAYVDTSANNTIKAINGSWYATWIKQYYNHGITFHTTSSTVSANDTLLDGTGANTHERMRITNDGKIGIGTTSPGSYNSNTNNFVIRDSGSGGITISTGASNTGYVAFNDGEDTTIEGLIAYNQSNDVMSFRTASTDDRLVIDGSGNVGIGTESPAQGLHLASGKQARFDDHVSIQPTKRLYIDGGGDTFIEETAANEMTFTTANAERMRINTTGVGIGTASPAGVLDIPSGSYSATKPAIMLGGDIDTTGAGSRTDNTRKYSSIVGYHYSNEEQPIGIMAYDCQSDSVAIINYGIPSGNYNAPTVHRWHTASNATTTAGTERMRINDAGNIGVGLTNPSGRVHSYVADNDKALSADGVGRVNLTVQSSETGGKIWYFRTAGTGNYGSGAGDLHVLNEAGTAITTWDYSASTFNGDLNDTSDVALKENITDITDATTKIKALKPRNFDWKESTKANGVDGFIAQEVETVLPNNVVGENYDSDNPEHGSKAINTSGILAVAVKAIQELEARIKTLEDA